MDGVQKHTEIEDADTNQQSPERPPLPLVHIHHFLLDGRKSGWVGAPGAARGRESHPATAPAGEESVCTNLLYFSEYTGNKNNHHERPLQHRQQQAHLLLAAHHPQLHLPLRPPTRHPIPDLAGVWWHRGQSLPIREISSGE